MIIDPIDCTTNLCGLAWLIRDNPSLVPFVRAQCSNNGPYFDELNATAFRRC